MHGLKLKTKKVDPVIRVGSLFAGIGGFELGAQWAFEKSQIPHEVLFQVEQNSFCQKVLKKHWPDSRIFDDVRAVGNHNLPEVDILIGGFPCQDISHAGKQKGIINGQKSSLWFEMLRIIGELRPRIAVMENVPAISRVGGTTVVGGLTKIGYDCQWIVISARQFGAPHLRKRWFCVATDANYSGKPIISFDDEAQRMSRIKEIDKTSDTPGKSDKQHPFNAGSLETKKRSEQGCSGVRRKGQRDYWERFPIEPPIYRGNDGLSDRMDRDRRKRLKALGNAIVPQCSEYIFTQIIKNIIQ